MNGPIHVARDVATFAAHRAVPLAVYRRVMSRNPLGFCYHVVSDENLGHIRNIMGYKTPRMFEADLVYLLERFRPLGYDALARHAAEGSPAPANSFFLSFDDGYAECFHVVRPLLLKYGVPCLFFVPTDFVDNRRLFYRNKVSLCIQAAIEAGGPFKGEMPGVITGSEVHDQASFIRWVSLLEADQEPLVDRVAAMLGVDFDRFLKESAPYMTSAQLRVLASEGFTIGAHGRGHRRMRQLREAEIEEEILASCRQVREWTGAGKVPFAFPFSADGVDRALLAGLTSRDDHVDLLFDANGLRNGTPFMVNRILADRPPPNRKPASNIGSLLRRAYAEDLLSGLRRGLMPR